jgi:hypothetical protein
MSIERDLLIRAKVLIECLDTCILQDQADIILSEINELLAQPEQELVKFRFTTRLDQEPVMYQYRAKLAGKDWGRWNLCNKIDYEDYKNDPTFQHWTYQTRKLLAQPEPEQEPVAWMYEWEEIGGKEWTSVKNGKYPPIVEEEYCMRNLRPLYTAPPKREPLSDEEIDKGYQESDGNYYDLAFRDGVRFAEKHNGVGVDDE